MYVVLLLAFLSLVGALIPYVKPFFVNNDPGTPSEKKAEAFKNYTGRIFSDSALSQNEKDSLIAVWNGDSVSTARWRRQADSIQTLLANHASRESIDSFFVQVGDAPVKRININEATAVELGGLPGVGERIAERIIEYRNKNGNFRSVEDLQHIKGIGKKMFAKIKPFVEIQ